MRVRWLGVGLVGVLVVCTLVLKNRTQHKPAAANVNGTPAVVLVADLREADDPHDRCADIIRAVREASKRGVHVAELTPDSKSDLLKNHHILTFPTVLLLDASGKEVERFEGEDIATVSAIQTRLAALGGSNP